MDWATIKDGIKTAFQTAAGAAFDVDWEHTDSAGEWRPETRIDLRIVRVRELGQDLELIEEASSADVDATTFPALTAWTGPNSPLGGQTDPEGGTEAVRFSDVSGAAVEGQTGIADTALVPGLRYTFSVRLSGSELTELLLSCGSDFLRVRVDCSDGSVFPIAASGFFGLEISGGFASGWASLEIKFNPTQAAVPSLVVYPAAASSMVDTAQDATQTGTVDVYSPTITKKEVTINRSNVGQRLLIVQALIQTDEQDAGGTAPGQVASDVKTRLQRRAVLEALAASGVSLVEMGDTINADYVYQDRHYSGATFELSFNVVEADTYEDASGSWIETVQVYSNKIKDSTGSVTGAQVDLEITKP